MAERLLGGQVARDVLRIGATVRRPTTSNSVFVQELLNYLERAGFDGAPRACGFDEEGRQILTYIEGVVPHGEEDFSEAALIKAAQLLRRFHDTTANGPLRAGQEVVCHGDVGPHNMVFANQVSIAFIDWDDARPGHRLDDVADAVWSFTNLACDGRHPRSHVPRIAAFCAGYGNLNPVSVTGVIEQKLRQAYMNHRSAGRIAAAEIFAEWIGWFDSYAVQLCTLLREHA